MTNQASRDNAKNVDDNSKQHPPKVNQDWKLKLLKTDSTDTSKTVTSKSTSMLRSRSHAPTSRVHPKPSEASENTDSNRITVGVVEVSESLRASDPI